MIVVKHLDQIVFDSRQHPSALRPYCSNIEHPSVDSLQKGHGHRYENYMEVFRRLHAQYLHYFYL